jgi:NhaP-type Na+/H+ or K+/H+ antiporter
MTSGTLLYPCFSFPQAFIHILFPKLDFVSSLVISACVTPTDPIISAAVVGQW